MYIVRWLTSRWFRDNNAYGRQQWLARVLGGMTAGQTILDAGAGELQNRKWCEHLVYTSQDVCVYDGSGDSRGLQTGQWDTTSVDWVCDILDIPDGEIFDIVLCSEVLEHTVDPVRILGKLATLVRPGGYLILTAPFASMVHFAPHFHCTGFSRYWYEHHLSQLGCSIIELTPNSGWAGVLRQELIRLPSVTGRANPWLAWMYALLALPLIIALTRRASSTADSDIGCFGWYCLAKRASPLNTEAQ